MADHQLPRELMESCLAAAQEATFQGFDDSVLKDQFLDAKLRRIFATVYRMGFESGWRIREQQIAHGVEVFPLPPAKVQAYADNNGLPPAGAQALAERFHEAYERLAPHFGYTTRRETRAFDPQSANGRLMVAVCRELLTLGVGAVQTHPWAHLPDAEVLRIAPMQGNFSADEQIAFCAGFRRCAQALAADGVAPTQGDQRG